MIPASSSSADSVLNRKPRLDFEDFPELRSPELLEPRLLEKRSESVDVRLRRMPWAEPAELAVWSEPTEFLELILTPVSP
mmetsp:Transcript_145037/g.270379  ORF Transcript_145037/g.270379 Transcript_145037/m.270379 type:complete len:80 (-) Transcript_145037:533-772(-)